MGYDDFILTVNSSSIIILLGMAAVLLAATRFRGENGYAAAIIVLPNVPVYLYNMSRMLGAPLLVIQCFFCIINTEERKEKQNGRRRITKS